VSAQRELRSRPVCRGTEGIRRTARQGGVFFGDFLLAKQKKITSRQSATGKLLLFRHICSDYFFNRLASRLDSRRFATLCYRGIGVFETVAGESADDDRAFLPRDREQGLYAFAFGKIQQRDVQNFEDPAEERPHGNKLAERNQVTLAV
jgi:hypothetical protein